MKAVCVSRFGPPKQACLAEMPDPVAGPDQMVIAVILAEANYPDLLMVEGRYQMRPALPFTPGTTAVGYVIEVGVSVRGFAVGQRVVAHVDHGAYAQKLLAAACYCHAVPDAIGDQAAAALGLTYQTAWFACARGGLQAGETVLVLGGSGGVGIAAIQLAKALRAGLVIAAVRTEADAGVAHAAGADGVVLVGGTAEPVRETLRRDVKALASGGVDVVIDPVGGAVGEAALRALAWSGRMVVVGFAAGAPPEVRANYLLVKNVAVLGLQWTDYRDRHPERVAEAQQEIFRLAQQGRLRPVIQGVWPLSQFQEALCAFQDGSVQGKLLLDPREAKGSA